MKTPRFVFFSGGSALRDFSENLARINPNSVHLLTTFDSGGSTAQLRKSFAMPAIGDIRNRMLALADRALVPRKILELLDMRLDPGLSFPQAQEYVIQLARSGNEIWRGIPENFRDLPLRCLNSFLDRMPASFDARGASIGNIIMTGAYLRFNRDFAGMLHLFHNFLHIRGTIRPIVESNLSLAAQLHNGETVVGQHLFKNLPSPVNHLFLTVHESSRAIYEDKDKVDCHPAINQEVRDFILSADAIVYPMGSFYSSLVANLVPHGVGQAIAANPCVKIYVPNTGHDPEQTGMNLADQVETIQKTLAKDAPEGGFLDYILIDRKQGVYIGGLGPEIEERVKGMGARVATGDLIDQSNRHDPMALYQSLVKLLP